MRAGSSEPNEPANPVKKDKNRDAAANLRVIEKTTFAVLGNRLKLKLTVSSCTKGEINT